MTARPLTPEERREAIRYCADGDENSDATARTVACAAHDAISETEFGSWPAAAALLSAGWNPGTMPTAGQIQAVAVEAVARLLRRHGLDVAVRPSRGAAVGAALAGPVTVRYTIEAEGVAP